ncbi:uncharacterized protein LOC119653523 isoform X3 [Hermetia illucens]|uniref:uncharacterized protein LOC119653523 isoform X3 n=1 Tax=Hermetia illucens TaxID=343691 RepID=UPI0018CC3041|nr:uncharacterized protein LOC119653523 isoform X3 [Hermetia illucens]
MSTRKSTNKQNADSIVSLSQDLSTPRSKQSQDAGSETSEPPTTPTSRDSNQSIPAESKRKRRTNSTQSISTPKRSTSEAKDSAANESNDKSATKDTEEKTQIANTDTPRRRKRRIIEKTSTMSTRKSLADIAAKNAPLRTSARSASKGTSPDDNPKPKRGRKRKADLITTPIKKEPKDSNQSDNEAYEVPDVKRIKIEKVDNEDPEEEILMEIRTEILADIRIKQEDEDKNQVIKIKDENSIKSTESAPKEVKSMSDKATERKTLSNDSKDDEVVILNTPEKIVSIEDGSPGDSAEGQTGVVKKRRGRKSAANKPQEKKRPTPTKPAKLVTPPKRRGRKPASLLLQSKTTPPAKKTTRKPSKSPVPEKSDSTKTQVPATIENEETSNLEPGELIFSTTTGDVNSDSKDQQREPLLIDTTTQNSEGKDSIPSTECTAGSEKSASLSPVELESEGLSAVSVKQFYKKPEFLENNLGIEEDPKLGEIVQNVEKEPVREEEKESVVEDEKESVVEDENEITKKIEDCVEKGDKDTEQKIEEESMQKIEKETTKKSEKETAQKTEKETPPKVKKESKLTVEEIQEVLDEDKEESDGKASDVQGADDLEANEVLKEEKNDKTESLPQSKESTPNVKSPESVQGTDEADMTGSDSLKEGELLVLEDSTEEENTLSQKTDKNGGSKVSSPTPTEVKTEPETATDSGMAEVKPSSEESEMEPEIVASEEDQQVDDQGLKKDEIVEDKTIEKDSAVVKNPPNSDVKQIDLKLTEKSAAEITPEDEKEDSKKILVNGDGTDNALLDNDDLEKDAMANECSAMEIDSGVSDVAENNSNDPNEDLNILQEIIESENPKGEISDSDGIVVGVLPGELEVDKKEDVVDIKEKIQVVESLKVKEIQSTPEKKDIAPIIIRKIHETPETLKQKETHFKSLGLLTIKAADEAKIEKQKRRQQLHSSSSTSSKKLNGNACMGDSPEATSGDPGATAEATTADKKEVVIPEKASSFAIHPGRLCQDQCFYCGGKFGLYDTPCHVAQLKSLERQRKILDNEEKLTVDNCLCDACFRHVDRRANAAVQKKRLSAPGNSTGNIGDASAATGETNESADGGNEAPMPIPPGHSLAKSVCFVTNCGQPASHTFRRKGFRKTIRKLLGNDIDMTNMGGRLPICDKHYELIIQCLECALCKRRLIRNHMYHITQDVQLLESLLVKQGIPVKLQANPAVCKLCRYFTNLLVKPPEGKLQKAQFVKNYRRRLLHFHNVQESDEESEAEDQDESASKTKTQSPTQQPAKRGRKPKNQQATTVSQTITSSAPASSEEGNSSNDVVDLEADVAPTSGQMQLDNDVMVDYDMPVLSDSPSPPAISQPSKLQTILQGGSVARSNDDISMALRANPNISMRELFPGEEEMGLQVNVPFGGSSSQRTPEGWTRVQTFLQYDEPTRRLWEDLQKPYGNQSSFIRHLILLEKYFRNGDLILSQTASTNAVAYSETVQNRLRSYDYRASSPTASKNNATASTSSNSSKTNQNQQQQQTNSSLVNNSSSGNSMTSGSHKTSSSNNSRQAGNVSVPDPIKKLHSNLTITITPKGKAVQEATQVSTPSSVTGTTSSNNSILKSNLLARKNSAIEIIPIASAANNDSSSRLLSFPLTKQQKLLAAASHLTSTSTNPNPQKSLNWPPELISINRGGSNSLLIGNRNPTNTIASAKNKIHSISHQQQQRRVQHSVPARPLKLPPTFIKLPATLTEHERLTSRHWRPTLLPINSGPPVRSAPGVLYQTADGRKLPSLVQVQSRGKPYLISIHDYNRMCILRREKLIQDQMMKKAASSSRTLGNSGNSLLKGALSSTSSSATSSSNSDPKNTASQMMHW